MKAQRESSRIGLYQRPWSYQDRLRPFVGLNHFTVTVAISTPVDDGAQYWPASSATRTAISRLAVSFQ